MRARLLGYEGELLREFDVPDRYLPPVLELPVFTSLVLWDIDPTPVSPVFERIRCDLEFVLGPADGGPLAIYRQQKIEFHR